MAVAGRLSIRLDLEVTKTIDPGLPGRVPVVKEYSWQIASGIGAEQVNVLWSDDRTLATGANEDLDVAGTLKDAFGGDAIFAKVKGLLIVARGANTTQLTITRPATSGFPFLLADGDGFILGPGDMFLITRRAAAGMAITGGADDVINIANAAGASATYDIFVLGTDS